MWFFDLMGGRLHKSLWYCNIASFRRQQTAPFAKEFQGIQIPGTDIRLQALF
jgi:hypothetical protein